MSNASGSSSGGSSKGRNFVGELRRSASNRWRKTRTTIRLVAMILGLSILWLLIFSWLPLAAGSYAQEMESEELRELLSFVGDLNAAQQLYLVLAISVPWLLYLFGAGALSQSGTMAYEPES